MQAAVVWCCLCIAESSCFVLPVGPASSSTIPKLSQFTAGRPTCLSSWLRRWQLTWPLPPVALAPHPSPGCRWQSAAGPRVLGDGMLSFGCKGSSCGSMAWTEVLQCVCLLAVAGAGRGRVRLVCGEPCAQGRMACFVQRWSTLAASSGIWFQKRKPVAQGQSLGRLVCLAGQGRPSSRSEAPCNSPVMARPCSVEDVVPL